MQRTMKMYKVVRTTRFRKENKLIKKRGYDVTLLKYVIKKLKTEKLSDLNMMTMHFPAISNATAHAVS